MINVKDIYDKANSITGVSQKEFVTFVNEAVLQLVGRYGGKYIYESGDGVEIKTVDDSIPVYAEWKIALINYVVYLKNGDALRKAEYDSSLDYIYRTIWKRRMGNRTKYRANSWN
jgi:hypothetical protein